MAYDIFLTDLETKKKFQFPSLPQAVKLNKSTSYGSYHILDLGEVQFPNGNAPDGVSWEGVFYGSARKGDSFLIRTWVAPSTAHSTLTQWKEKGTPLKLVVAGTPINLDVTIAAYEGTFSGGFGDLTYSISFVKYQDITIKVTKAQNSNANTNTTKRATTTPKTHTVKDGDKLWTLAQKFYGSGAKYTVIYNANKDIIESTAKKRGYSSSENGHWIFPGTVLTIP